MNIVFLDVDGVLNSLEHLIEVYNKTGKPHHGVNYPFDEKCMLNLKRLVEETNSALVITSSWRKYEDHKKRLIEELEKYELEKYVIGYTKDLGNRVLEIKEYLNSIGMDVNFIILDDSAYLEDLVEYLIATNAYYGLREVDVEQAKLILSKGE